MNKKDRLKALLNRWRVSMLFPIFFVLMFIVTAWSLSYVSRSMKAVMNAKKGASCRLGTVAADMAKRNIFWRVMNREAFDSIPESPEKNFAPAIALFLHRDSSVELRKKALQMYDLRIFLYLSEKQLEETLGLHSEDNAQRAKALAVFTEADYVSSQTLRGVLADNERIDLFLAGKPIPLETLSDGTTP